MGHGSWWTLHMEPNQSDASGYTRTSISLMVHLTNISQGSWLKGLHRNKVLIMRRLLLPQQNRVQFVLFALGNTKWMESSSNECEDRFLEWRLERGGLHVPTRRFCCVGTRVEGMQTYQISLWSQTSTASLVWKIN